MRYVTDGIPVITVTCEIKWSFEQPDIFGMWIFYGARLQSIIQNFKLVVLNPKCERCEELVELRPHKIVQSKCDFLWYIHCVYER